MHIGIVGPVLTEQLKPLLSALPPNYPKGLGGIPVNNLILELIKRGRKLSVFTLSPDVNISDAPVILEGKNIKIYYGPFRNRARTRMLDFFKNERNFLKNTLLEVKPDFIHAHWQYEWGWAALDSSIPTLLTCHDSPLHVLRMDRTLYRFGRLLMAIHVLSRARNLSTVSPYTANGIKYLTKKEIEIIPNFEPNYVFDMHKPRKLSDNPKIAMVNNGFGERKNTEIGIKAFNGLLKKFPYIELHLFGKDFGKGEPAEMWARSQGYLENIYFRGYFDFNTLISEFNKIDILLHPALEESFGMVIIEANALGIPVIAGEHSGGVPWVLNNGKAGVQINVKDEKAIVMALHKLCHNSDLYNRISLAGRINAKNRFSAEVVVDQYESSYRRLHDSILREGI